MSERQRCPRFFFSWQHEGRMVTVRRIPPEPATPPRRRWVGYGLILGPIIMAMCGLLAVVNHSFPAWIVLLAVGVSGLALFLSALAGARGR